MQPSPTDTEDDRLEVETPTGSRQFSLRSLFWTITLLSLALLPVAYRLPSGWLISLGIAVTVVVYWLDARYIMPTMVVGLLLLLICGSFVFLLDGGGRTPSVRSSCIMNMSQISLSVLLYEEAHGHLPPPYVVDDNGKPMHSWRVLILPYLEEQELYDQYDFSKPWDHPDNLKLADQMPWIYRCPGDTSPYSDRTTTYVAIVGEQTMWPPTGKFSGNENQIRMVNALMLVESPASRTQWMAPNDLKIDDIAPVAPDGSTPLIEGAHPGGSLAVFASGHTTFLPNTTPAAQLKAMATLRVD